MENKLTLYKLEEGNAVPFPYADRAPVEVPQFTYNAQRMGGAPTLTFTLMYGECLDDLWSDSVFAEFRGEKYFIRSIPTSSFSNADARYKHDVTLVSEREILDNVYFYDVVVGNDMPTSDKFVSNSAKVVFSGKIEQFVDRLNASLQYAKLQTKDGDGSYSGYRVVIDEGVVSEDKLLSFENQFFTNVLQEVYNTYKVPYYFVGKTIHIGEVDNLIGNELEPLQYGSNDAFLSVNKTNANTKIVNRITATGSTDNIPYYYPNPTPYGDVAIVAPSNLDVKVVDWNLYAAQLGLEGFIKYHRPEEPVDQSLSVDDFDTIWSVTQDYETTTLEVSCPISIQKGRETSIDIEFTPKQDLSDFVWCNDIIVSEPEATYAPLYSAKKNTGIPQKLSLTGLPAGNYWISVMFTTEATWEGDFTDEEIWNDAKKWISIEAIIRSSSSTGWYSHKEGAVVPSRLGMVIHGIPKENDTIYLQPVREKLPSSDVLLPSIYRESWGTERFYNAENDTYEKPEGGMYSFNNPYQDGAPREHIIQIEDVKPSIKGMTNADGLRMDMFAEFAYDEGDSDDFDVESEQYKFPYFFAKLRKLDGEHGFNLFDHAIEGQPMTFEMTSGDCGSCKFTIGVDEKSMKNIVQVNEDGSLMRDQNGQVLIRPGNPQERQNDTVNNEVWIALKKEDSTYGILMPKAQVTDVSGNILQVGHRPKADLNNDGSGDTFVITGIHLPEAYILAAEKELEAQAIKYMADNNDERFTFSVKFSRIYFAENPEAMARLSENSQVCIAYNNFFHKLYVSSYSYKIDNSALPEVSVQLTEQLTVPQNALKNAVQAVKRDIMGSIPNLKTEGSKYFLRKDTDDVALGRLSLSQILTLYGGVKSDDYSDDILSGTGWKINKDAYGQSILEIDKIFARKELKVNKLVVNQTEAQKGNLLITKGGCEVALVEEIDNYYRCYYDTNNGSDFSGFLVGDFAYCQRYDASFASPIKYYWREVVGVGSGYVDLAKVAGDGTGIPSAGDNIVQLGNKNDKNRQSAIFISPDNGGSVKVYSAIDTFSLSDKDYVGMGVNPSTNRAYLYGYGDMFFGDRNLEKQFITYQIPEGQTEPELRIKANITLGADSTGLSNLSEFQNVQSKVDQIESETSKEYTMWFGESAPTSTTLPESDWTTDETKNAHIGDLYYSDSLGKAWRFEVNAGNYRWAEITDAQTLAALEKASAASDAASIAQKTANDANTAAANAYNRAEELFQSLQDQLDGKVESFFESYDPSLDNEPAVSWDTTELKESHLNDTFTNTESGRSWRWLEKDGVYQWVEIADTQASEALAKANEALGLASGKVAVFVDQPISPYNAKDIWLQGDNGRIKYCTTTRTEKDAFYEADWADADNYYEEIVKSLADAKTYTDGQLSAYKTSVQNTVDSLNNAIGKAQEDAQKYTDEAKDALEESLRELNEAKANISSVYSIAEADKEINKAEQKAIEAAQQYANAAKELAVETSNAYADGVVSKEEAVRIKDAQAKLAEAKAYADEQAALAESSSKSYTDKQLGAVVNSFEAELDQYGADLDAIRAQTDKEYTIWFGDAVPTLYNEPAVNWATKEELAKHEQDMYFSNSQDRAWRFVYSYSSYKWEEITDERIKDALDKAQEALHTANQSKTIAEEAKNYIQDVLPGELESLQTQIDGKVESFFYDNDSDKDTLADSWDDKQSHTGDTFTNIKTGASWRWNGTSWVLVENTATQQALQKAAQAQDTADGKRTVFYRQSLPTPPYQVGDLWSQGDKSSLRICIAKKQENDAASNDDWVDADDAHKYTDAKVSEYKAVVDSTVDSLNSTIEQVSKAAKDYTDEGRQTLQQSIDALSEAKANLNDVYTRAEADGVIQQAEEAAVNAALEVAKSAEELANTYANAYADQLISDEEAARIAEAKAKLEEAKAYAEQKAQEAENGANNYTNEKTQSISVRVNEQQATLDEYGVDISKIKAQTDKEYTIWFGDDVPTLSNLPAKDWTENEYKDRESDMYFSDALGKAWRFEYDSTTNSYKWNEITDNATLAALQTAQDAQRTAEEAKSELAQYKQAVDSTIEDINTAIEGVNEEIANVDKNSSANAEALSKSLADLDAAKANLEDVYNKAIVDGKIDDVERKALEDAQKAADAALAEAKKHTDNAKEEVEGKIQEIEYLKKAFSSGYMLETNGAILSTFIGVKNDEEKVVAGLYGGASGWMNQTGFGDENGNRLMIFAGADGISEEGEGSVETSKFKVWSDGTIFANKGVFGGVLKKYPTTITPSNIQEYIHESQTRDGEQSFLLDLTKCGSFIIFEGENWGDDSSHISFYLPSIVEIEGNIIKFPSTYRYSDFISYLGAEVIALNNTGREIYGCNGESCVKIPANGVGYYKCVPQEYPSGMPTIRTYFGVVWDPYTAMQIK